MSDKLPRILITGAGGFLGRPLVTALSTRARIVPTQIDGRRAGLLDPSDRAALIDSARADILIHLAWVTEHGQFWSAASNADWQEASQDLFQRFYAAGGSHIIGTGSCAEYDWTTGAERFSEDAPLNPHTPYGEAKVRTAEALARLAEQTGASWAWGRVFFSFGPGEPAGRLVPLMLRAAQSGTPLHIGPDDTVRDFCAVQHVAAALAALALSRVRGPVNLASGYPVSFRDLAAIVDGLTDGPPVIRPNRRPLGLGEPRVLVADTARLHEEVGFAPPDRLSTDLEAYFASHFRKSAP